MENDVKRLRMRSWHRGIKEMDLILGAYADHRLAELEREDLTLYEALLEENDHDLYQWVSGQVPPPEKYASLIDDIAANMEAKVSWKPA